MKKKVLILSGGQWEPDLIKEKILELEFNLLIAVDGGLTAADKMGLTVDYLVGDFDTVDRAMLAHYQQIAEETGRPIIRSFCAEKDETDTEIAIMTALEQGADEIYLMGGTGTRLDHTLANIHLLKKALDFGIPAYIYDKNNKIYLIDNTFTLHKSSQFGRYISLIPLTEKVEGVTLTGFKYPLVNHKLIFGNSLGVSNEIIEKEAVISLSSGILVIFETKD